MSGIADTNLVLALLKPNDALHARAKRHVAKHPGLVVPLSVGLELLIIAAKHDLVPDELIDVVDQHFILEHRELLIDAASAMTEREIPTAFDAVHAVEALHRGTTLHTADARLLRTDFPTTPF
jgi:predicted nucleic acid-binding protein